MVNEASAAVATVAFTALVVYLIRTLKKGMVSLEETNKTLAEVRIAVHDLTQEAKHLIHTANQITTDVKGKIRAVEPLLESAHDVGEALHSVTNTVKQAAAVLGNGGAPSINPATPNKMQIKVR